MIQLGRKDLFYAHAGMTIEALERLTLAQDADAVFAILYVSRLLAPPAPLPPNLLPSAWVDGDDLITKIGWKPRSRAEREEMLQHVSRARWPS